MRCVGQCTSLARPRCLTGEQACELLDSIDVTTLIGLRDRALILVMTFAFARIGAMRVEDYYGQRQALVGPPA